MFQMKSLGNLIIIHMLLSTLAVFRVSASVYYISPSGSLSGTGTVDSPFLKLQMAVDVAQPGDTIFLRGGKYEEPSTIIISQVSGKTDSLIAVYAYADEIPVFCFKSMAENSSNRGIILNADYWHFKDIVIEEAGDNGMLLSGNHNIIENCTFRKNHDTGLQLSRYSSDATTISSWPSYNQILHCEAYDNKDSDNEDADGFAAKLTCGVGNIFKNCVSHHNIDDGWDMYTKSSTGPIGAVTLIECIAHSNGTLTDGVSSGNGDKNGFKLGGEDIPVNHKVLRCVAFNNGKHGFTYNRNLGTMLVLNNTSYNNAERNFSFDGGTSVFANNLSFETGINDRIIGTDEGKNAWDNDDASYTVSVTDFVTLNPGADSIPLSDGFLNLAEGSQFIEEGKLLTEVPFNGSVPDIGAVESDGIPAPYINITSTAGGAVSVSSGYYPYLTELEIAAIPDKYYYFSGWIGDTVTTDDTITFLLDTNMMISANFNTDGLILTVDIEGSGRVSISPDKETYIPGEKVILTATPEDEDWILNGWSHNSSLSDETIEIVMDSNITITAYFVYMSGISKNDYRNLSFEIIPNPSRALIQIHSDQIQSGKCNFVIYSMDGRIIHNEIIMDIADFNLDISDYKPGMYLLILNARDINYSGTFIKL